MARLNPIKSLSLDQRLRLGSKQKKTLKSFGNKGSLGN